MIEVQPGQSYRYDFPIPLDHPSGLHWYHPHNHGSTDVQVSNGMAGLIVVRGPIDEVPEIKAAREIFMVVQTLDVNPSKKNKNLYEREYISFRSPQNGGYTFSTQFTMITLNGQGINWVDNRGKDKIYKQLPLPQFNVKPGEVVRIRLLNGTNYLPLFLAIPGFDAWQIGFDGVNTLKPIYIDMSGKGVTEVTPENLFSSKNRLAMSANRIELLLRAPQKPGTYTMKSLASDRIFFKLPALPMANFVVSGNPVTMSIPKKLPVPTREYPVIEDKDIVNKRTFKFDQGARTDLLMGFGFTINGNLYQMDAVPTAVRSGNVRRVALRKYDGGRASDPSSRKFVPANGSQRQAERPDGNLGYVHHPAESRKHQRQHYVPRALRAMVRQDGLPLSHPPARRHRHDAKHHDDLTFVILSVGAQRRSRRTAIKQSPHTTCGLCCLVPYDWHERLFVRCSKVWRSQSDICGGYWTLWRVLRLMSLPSIPSGGSSSARASR